jgi:transforming growth factor-beta-induced protein
MKLFAAAAAMFAFAANTAVSAQSIAEIVVGSPDHMTLEAAVLAAPSAVLELLSDETRSLTLFAPDDSAFAALIAVVGEDYVNDLLTPMWSNHLVCVLASHVLEGAVPSSAITGPLTVTSLFGTVLSVDNVDGVVTVNGNDVTAADIMASNGVVHSISGLPILPPCVTENIVDVASADDNFSTLVSLVVAAGLADALATSLPITVLAPTNEAFADLPGPVLVYLAGNVTALAEVLLYHVLPGNEFFGLTSPNTGTFETLLEGKTVEIKFGADGITEINDASDMIALDILASNGVIQVIDEVLIPPGFTVPDVPSAPVAAVVPAPVAPPMPVGGKKGGMMGMSESESKSASKSSKKSGSRKRDRRGLRQ